MGVRKLGNVDFTFGPDNQKGLSQNFHSFEIFAVEVFK